MSALDISIVSALKKILFVYYYIVRRWGGPTDISDADIIHVIAVDMNAL